MTSLPTNRDEGPSVEVSDTPVNQRAVRSHRSRGFQV